MPIEWSRFYASDLAVESVLGRGWVLPWEQSLRRSGSFVYLTDNQGRSVPFVDIDPGESVYNPYEQIYLVRSSGGHYLLQTLDNTFFYFGEVHDDNTQVPLQRLENALGHYLHFSRTADGTLTDISAPVRRSFGPPDRRQAHSGQCSRRNPRPVSLHRRRPVERSDQTQRRIAVLLMLGKTPI